MVKTNSKTETNSKIKFTHWSPVEHEKLVTAVILHGTKNWHVVALKVGTRNSKQCRSHYQKFEKRIKEV